MIGTHIELIVSITLLIFVCDKLIAMTHVTIDNKKYVIIPEANYQKLQRQAALKWKPEKTFSVEEARAHSKALIRKWATVK